MMLHHAHVTMLWNGSHLAVDASVVDTILALPELAPFPEMPRQYVGVFNLHGVHVPVIDLNLLFGLPRLRYAITDHVIVLTLRQRRVGIIAQDVFDIETIPADDIVDIAGELLEDIPASTRLLAGITNIGGCQVAVLDHTALTAEPGPPIEGGGQAAVEEEQTMTQSRYFCSDASEEERAIFRERAFALAVATHDEGLVERQAVAVAVLNGELFGIALASVHGFTDLVSITPVPCSRDGIVGQINHRGAILTILDIRPMLHMPPRPMAAAPKAAIITMDSTTVGIMVDEVLDVIHLAPSDVAPVPAAVRIFSDEFVRGSARYMDRMISILDLQAILSRPT